MQRMDSRDWIAALVIGALTVGLAVACDYDDATRDTASVTVTEDEDAAPDVAARAGGAYDATADVDVDAADDGFQDHRRNVEVVLTDVADIPLLIPAAIFVAEGTRSILVRNESEVARTFEIDGLENGRRTLIPAGQSVTVVLGDIEPRGIYAIVLGADPEGQKSASASDAGTALPDVAAEPDPAATGAAEGIGSDPAAVDSAPDTAAEPRTLGTLIVLPGVERTAAAADRSSTTY